MNTKIRLVCLFVGFLGLVFATNNIITTFPDVNPSGILYMAVSVMILFFLTRRPYSSENEEKKERVYHYDRVYHKE